MLDVLEYGIDRVTDPNEDKVNQVRKHFFTSVESGRIQAVLLALWCFWRMQAEQVSSAMRAKRPEAEAVLLSTGCGALKIALAASFGFVKKVLCQLSCHIH